MSADPGRSMEMPRMKWLIYLLAVVVLVMHQDFWNFQKIEPLAIGFLPVGLWYHALYAVVCAILMGLLVMFAWPKHLEKYERDLPPEQRDVHGGH
jgi:hypothetical protein